MGLGWWGKLIIARIVAVILCTPHAPHTGQILRAAEKGKHMEANVSILEAVVTSTRIGQRVQIFSTSRPPQL
ncbi:MAG: hypothetical protein EBX90_00240 [Betaproteobacteria bacterium]|nr:hypothetical protein [Betaproteobacteria bacterium]